MASFSSNLFSFIMTRGPKDIILFFVGLTLSLGLFFGGGIFLARLIIPGLPGIFLGILFGIGVILAIAFTISFSYLAKMRKMLR
jgi:hypothetical protein